VTVEQVVYQGQLGLWTALQVGGPLLATALVVGTIVSLLQAVTQIQEVTLVFVPKMLAVFAVMAFAGGWMLKVMVAYATTMFLGIPDLTL